MAFDEAINEYGTCGWSYSVLGEPQKGRQTAENVSAPLSAGDFVREFCRPVTGVKSSWLMLDVQRGVPEFGNMDNTYTVLKAGQLHLLPEHIRPKDTLPANTKVGIIVANKEDGTCDVIKILLPDGPKPVKLLAKCLQGEGFVPQMRSEPHAVKKAFVASLKRILGFHVSWASVAALTKPVSTMERKDSKTWCPPEAELINGVHFINNGDCPDDDGDNAQTVWILLNIKEGSGTPIEDWPEMSVRRMAENKSKATQGAEPQFFWPLTVLSTKPPMRDFLLPLLIPLMMNFGVILLGWPGVGKTPLIITMLLALSRYHVDSNDLTTKPSWRRGQTLEAFRHRGPQLSEGIFVDDPDVGNISMEDWKALLDRTVNGTLKSRYHDAKVMKNAGAGLGLNDGDEEDEPAAGNNAVVTADEMYALARKPFKYAKKAHVMACLKRALVFVFGKRALYIRLPSKDENATGHRIDDCDVHLDVFSRRDMAVYCKYLNNVHELPETFPEDAQAELDMVTAGMDKMSQYDSSDDYIQYCNTTIYEKLNAQTI